MWISDLGLSDVRKCGAGLVPADLLLSTYFPVTPTGLKEQGLETQDLGLRPRPNGVERTRTRDSGLSPRPNGARRIKPGA